MYRAKRIAQYAKEGHLTILEPTSPPRLFVNNGMNRGRNRATFRIEGGYERGLRSLKYPYCCWFRKYWSFA